jgi:hypothetical protein
MLMVTWKMVVMQICGLLVSCAVLHAEGLPVIHVWSGREQALPVPAGASWALVAEHGRELVSGSSQDGARLYLPALQSGARESASLFVNGKKQATVHIWSPEILAGFAAKLTESGERLSAELRKHGLKFREDAEICFTETPADDNQAALILCFPQRREFPVPIRDHWAEISLHHTKKGGILSVLYDKREQIVDSTGNLGYILLKAEKRRRYLFSPDFDFQSIDNILLLKTILEEKKP